MDHPVDLTHLERLTNKDKKMQAEVFNAFFKEADRCVRAMIHSRQEVDGKAWKTSVESLRAAAVHVGAMHLVEFLQTVEGTENLTNDVRATQVKIALREVGKVREFYETKMKE